MTRAGCLVDIRKRKTMRLHRKPPQDGKKTRDYIVQRLIASSGIAHSGHLFAGCGASIAGFTRALNLLLARGTVVKVRHRVYALPDAANKVKEFLYPSQQQTDRRVLEAMPIGKRMVKKEIFRIAGSLHSGRLTLARLQRLGYIEVISTKTVRRVK